MKLSSSVKLAFDELKQLSSKTSYSETSPSEYCGESLRRCGERVAFSPHVVKPVAFDDELSCSRAASCGHPFYCASYDEESESESESRGTSPKLAWSITCPALKAYLKTGPELKIGVLENKDLEKEGLP